MMLSELRWGIHDSACVSVAFIPVWLSVFEDAGPSLLWNTRTDGRVGSFDPILHIALRPEYMWRLVRLPDIWLCSIAL